MYLTKRDLITDSLSEIGFGRYPLDDDPGIYQRCLRIMDSMIARWDSVGLKISYPLSKKSDLDEKIEIPDSTHGAICLNLAILIAPGFGKNLSVDTRINAKRAYNDLLKRYFKPIEMKIGEKINGAGNKSFVFYDETTNDETINLNGDGILKI